MHQQDCDVYIAGFDKDPEAQHVWDISEKLANFVIETDTDTTSMPTDTGERHASFM